MQYAAGIGTALIVGLVLARYSGAGLMQLLVASGLGLMAYGLVDKQIKKRAGETHDPR